MLTNQGHSSTHKSNRPGSSCCIPVDTGGRDGSALKKKARRCERKRGGGGGGGVHRQARVHRICGAQVSSDTLLYATQGGVADKICPRHA